MSKRKMWGYVYYYEGLDEAFSADVDGVVGVSGSRRGIDRAEIPKRTRKGSVISI